MSRKIVGAWTDSSGNVRIQFDSNSRGNEGCGKGEVISFNENSVTYKQNGMVRQYSIAGGNTSHKYLGRCEKK